jgi:hypothetical protein
MRKPSRCIPILLLLLATAALPPARAASAAAAAPAPPAPTRGVRYEVHYMDLHAAEVLAWEQCPEALKDRCQVTAMSSQDSRVKYLDVTADSATHERIARALVKADSAPHTQVFQAVLLAASNRPGGTAPELSPGAQKALADIRGFLPFKSYEQLDAAWLRTTSTVEGHLVGRDGRQYRVWLRFKPVGGPDSKELFVDQFDLRENLSFPPATGAGSKEPPRNQRDLISTSFSLKQGETIVVGTSKSDAGDEALVLLLTAAG